MKITGYIVFVGGSPQLHTFHRYRHIAITRFMELPENRGVTWRQFQASEMFACRVERVSAEIVTHTLNGHPVKLAHLVEREVKTS